MSQNNSPENQFTDSGFLEYLQILRRRRWMVLLCIVGMVGLVVLINQYSTPVYEAEATIIYEEPKDIVFASNLGQPPNRTASINMTEQIKSRTLAEEVAQALPDHVVRTHRSTDAAPRNLTHEKFIVRQLQKNLAVEMVEGSDVLRIKVLANDANAAKVIANTYVERIIDSNLRNKREEISGIREFVEKQLAVFQNKLNAAEDSLRDFMEHNKITTMDDASVEILKRLTEAEASYNTAKTERAALEQRQLYLERKKRALAPSLPITGRPLAQEANLETLKAREKTLQKIMAEYEVKLQMLPQQELQLARLIRARDVNNKIYSMLLEKREEARITEAGKVGDVQVIDTAEEPLIPIRPKKSTNLALGFLLGLIIGVGLAFFMEFLDTSLKSDEDVRKYVNLPVLATIPRINSNGAISFIPKSHDSIASYKGKLIHNLNRRSHIYEAYRALQINFAFINTDHLLKSILVTSPGPGDGKTLTSINMAQVFAESKVKTLLVDCDLRRPMVHKVLGIDSEPGLTEVLINQVLPEQAIQRIQNKYPSILCSGKLPPNPAEILDTSRMRELLTQFRNEYDLIILDSAPLMAVTDALALSAMVDGVCLVIKAGGTRQEAARKAKQLLANGRSRVVGTILNNIDLKNVYGYYQGYYSDHESKNVLSSA